jgi:DNA polymerase I-like protein with 3'-5' exonuclease and polymerase domains
LVQATGRDVVFWQALQFMREGFRVVHLVHDEIVAVVPEAQADEAAERLLFWLRQAPPWAEGLPVDGEVGTGTRYSDAK